MTRQAALPPHLVFSELEQWWQIHEGFGLSYLFSDDALSMSWLRERIDESLRFESTPLSLSIIDSFDSLQLFLQALQSSTAAAEEPCLRKLVWIAPAKAQCLNAIKRLNEMRQLLLRSPHLYLVCLPSSWGLDAARLAADLWSVRSLVFSVQGQHWRAQPSFNWAKELGEQTLATSSASTPSIDAWNHFHCQWLAQTDAAKPFRLSVQLGLQAMDDAIALRQFQQAQDIGLQALSHAEQQQDDWSRAKALTLLGDLEQRLSQVDSAREHYIQAIELFEQEQYDLGRAHALRSLGDLEHRLGQVDSAREHFIQAIALYEKELDDLGRANALRSLGDLEHHLGLVDAARGRYTQAIALYEQEQNDLGRANALRSLGYLEHRLGQIDSAREHFIQAIALYEQELDDLGRANTLTCLGDLEHLLGQVDSAREHFIQAIALYKKEQDDFGLAYALKSLEDLERRLGQID